MNSITPANATTLQPPVKVRPAIDIEVLTSINPEVLEDSYVYVHCYFENPGKDMLIRIWRTTYLIDRASGARSKLFHAENVSFAPLWTVIPDGKTYNFLLIFGGLPRSCQHFDLVEEIDQPGGFFISNIPRNPQDVYHINIQ